MKDSNKSSGAYWMLVGIFVLLTVPMVIGHYTIAAEPAPVEQASATATQ